jgi:cytidine deaminase
VTQSPFQANPAFSQRLSAVSVERRAQIALAVHEAIADNNRYPAANMGGVVPASVCIDIIERFELVDIRELMCLLLETAQRYANPQISNFFVGAVGLEQETGNLILGGNVEFPGAHLGFTLHGEGFVVTRAMSRGTNLAVIAISEAHPCAHCRQCLSEYASAKKLELIDPIGHTLTLEQLYPWPFDPSYLGEAGAVPGRALWPNLHLAEPVVEAETLLAAGRLSHSPYSKCPGAVELTFADGQSITGIAVESVAFNPTITPIQAAMVNLLAHGYTYADITSAKLGTIKGGAVDYSLSTTELLSRIAPQAKLNILDWAI